MDKLICPDCGHDVDWHGSEEEGGCKKKVGDFYSKYCICELSSQAAYALAEHEKSQRAAAIAHLLELRRARDYCRATGEKKGGDDYQAIIKFVYNAYRAVGILPKPKERK